MARRVEYVSVEEARRLGSECGIGEAQASRGAFRMLANNPDLVKHVYGLLTMLSSRNRLPTRLRELKLEPRGTFTKDLDTLLQLARNMEGRTICVFADAAAWPIQSYIQKFRPEFEEYIAKNKRVDAAGPVALESHPWLT